MQVFMLGGDFLSLVIKLGASNSSLSVTEELMKNISYGVQNGSRVGFWETMWRGCHFL